MKKNPSKLLKQIQKHAKRGVNQVADSVGGPENLAVIGAAVLVAGAFSPEIRHRVRGLAEKALDRVENMIGAGGPLLDKAKGAIAEVSPALEEAS